VLIEVWADYLCPWCYLAQDRVRYLEEHHGADVRWRPFELHPEIPPEGGPAPSLRRPPETRARLRDQLAAAGLPARPRTTWSNSRRALALAAWAERDPAWPALHRGLYHAYWAEGRDLGDPEVLVAVATAAGVAGAQRAVADGAGLEGVAAARERALDVGIGSTPGWRLPGGVVFTGVHEREVFDRVVARASRHAE
jgi:predicted DsbA family dithiol-disulfide isomerase